MYFSLFLINLNSELKEAILTMNFKIYEREREKNKINMGLKAEDGELFRSIKSGQKIEPELAREVCKGVP